MLKILEIVFIFLGIAAYIYIGIRILRMRVRFIAFLYFFLLAGYALTIIFGVVPFIIGWTIFILVVAALIFIMAR